MFLQGLLEILYVKHNSLKWDINIVIDIVIKFWTAKLCIRIEVKQDARGSISKKNTAFRDTADFNNII